MGWELMRLFSYQDGRGYAGQISSELRLCDACHVGDALVEYAEVAMPKTQPVVDGSD